MHDLEPAFFNNLPPDYAITWLSKGCGIHGEFQGEKDQVECEIMGENVIPLAGPTNARNVSSMNQDFHVLLFINSLLTFSGINACFAGIFYGPNGISHSLLIFKVFVS